MKLYIWPKTDLGKISSLLGLVFIFLTAIKGAPLPDIFSGMLALIASLIGIAALTKKDNALIVFISVFTGIYALSWGLAALL